MFAKNDSSIVCNDSKKDLPFSFVVIVRVFTNKTASTLSSFPFIEYPIHVKFLNTSPSDLEWLINNGYTIIWFLPVSTSEVSAEQDEKDFSVPESEYEFPQVAERALDDDVRLTSSSDGREQNMFVLQAALSRALSSLEDMADKGFSFHTNKGMWNCFPIMVSYCSYIVEAKNVSAVKHNLSVVRPCHRCIATVSDFETMATCDVRQRLHTTHVRRVVAGCLKQIESLEKAGDVSQIRSHKKTIEATLKEYSLASWESFLESTRLVDRSAVPDLYSIFTFEPLHNLFLGVSKLLKHCFFLYLSSENLTTQPTGSHTGPPLFSSVKTAVLRGCNSVLSQFQSTTSFQE